MSKKYFLLNKIIKTKKFNTILLTFLLLIKYIFYFFNIYQLKFWCNYFIYELDPDAIIKKILKKNIFYNLSHLINFYIFSSMV